MKKADLFYNLEGKFCTGYGERSFRQVQKIKVNYKSKTLEVKLNNGESFTLSKDLYFEFIMNVRTS